ncbi:MAG: hypothetical protein ACOH5I_25945 [Oligoflexus sp.]
MNLKTALIATAVTSGLVSAYDVGFNDARMFNTIRDLAFASGNCDLVEEGYACPTDRPNIVGRTGFFNLETASNFTIYADRDKKNPGLVFSQDGKAYFPRDLESKNISSGGKPVIENGKWVGDVSGLKGDGCKISEDGNITCGSEGESTAANVLDVVRKNVTRKESVGDCVARGAQAVINMEAKCDEGKILLSCSCGVRNYEAIGGERLCLNLDNVCSFNAEYPSLAACQENENFGIINITCL